MHSLCSSVTKRRLSPNSKIGAVETMDRATVVLRVFKAVDVDDMEPVALPVAARGERLDAALGAELVRDDMRIEFIRLERLAPAHKGEIAVGHRMHHRVEPPAPRAIALERGFEPRPGRKAHGPAMAASLIDGGVPLNIGHRRPPFI